MGGRRGGMGGRRGGMGGRRGGYGREKGKVWEGQEETLLLHTS